MGWEDKARENLYLRDALRATDERDLERRMQNTDKTIDFFKDVGNAIGDVISDAINGKPSAPPPPPKSSGGNIAGKVLAGAAIAGGAYLLSKLFSGNDDNKKNSNISKSDSNNYQPKNNITVNQDSLASKINKYSKGGNAKKSLMAAASNGDSNAMKLLGDIYYNGFENIAKNKEESIKWYKKAASYGNHEAAKMISNVNSNKKNNNKSDSLKSEFANIKGLIKQKSNPDKIKNLLLSLEEKVESRRNRQKMMIVAEYFKNIDCKSDAERCYQKAATFN